MNSQMSFYNAHEKMVNEKDAVILELKTKLAAAQHTVGQTPQVFQPLIAGHHTSIALKLAAI